MFWWIYFGENWDFLSNICISFLSFTYALYIYIYIWTWTSNRLTSWRSTSSICCWNGASSFQSTLKSEEKILKVGWSAARLVFEGRMWCTGHGLSTSDVNSSRWLILWFDDWLVLTAWQPIWGYFISSGFGITLIIHIYLCVCVCGCFFRDFAHKYMISSIPI